jgi:NAD(P)-dependent dehydrogenase (short-subunit alcohol dehydrogenase family)
VPTASLEFLQLDLSSLAAVREAASELVRRHRSVHVLMLNAGVMACPFSLSQDGFEMQFATNHLGHFLFTYLLTDVLAKAAPARVVVVSSAASFIPEMLGGAALNFSRKEDVDKASKGAYGPWAAYGRSKLANVLFAQELAERFGAGSGVYVNALHPGGIRTNLQRHIPATGGEGLAQVLTLLFGPLLMSPWQGAVTQLYAATSPEIEAKGLTGKYFHPQARLTAPSKLATPEKRAELWALSMQLTAPQRAWFTPHAIKW